MKKLSYTLALALFVTFSFTQAQAALINDWSYDLVDITYTDAHNGTITNNGSGYYWEAEDKFNSTDDKNIFVSQATTTSHDGTVSFTEDSNEAFVNPEKVNDKGNANSNALNKVWDSVTNKPLTTLNFAYTVSSATAGVSMEFTYSIPLYTTSAWSSNGKGNDHSFIYYKPSEITVSGTTSVSFQEYTYNVSDFSYVVAENAMFSIDSNAVTYTGWVINGADRNNGRYGEPILEFDIDGAFMLSYIEGGVLETAPTPTPEPATMLLTGLGLAGIGAIKRRRNK